MRPIIKKVGEKDIESVQKIAQAAWPATYEGILERSFIDFELKREYSRESLLNAIQNGETFYLFQDFEGSALGYFSLTRVEVGNSIKVNKFYLWPHLKGKGLGKDMYLGMEKLIQDLDDIESIHLLVNRENAAINFYEKMGFKKVGEIDTPTHPGQASFVRRDFIMEKKV